MFSMSKAPISWPFCGFLFVLHSASFRKRFTPLKVTVIKIHKNNTIFAKKG